VRTNGRCEVGAEDEGEDGVESLARRKRLSRMKCWKAETMKGGGRNLGLSGIAVVEVVRISKQH
jgi:hypothetical protein